MTGKCRLISGDKCSGKDSKALDRPRKYKK